MWMYYMVSRTLAQDRLREAANDRLAAEARRARRARGGQGMLARLRGRGRGA